MIIHQPEIIQDAGRVRVFAHIESSTENIPDTLWFSFPENHTPYVTDRSEGFAASLVVAAMHFDEPLEIRGRISPKFAYGLEQFIHAYSMWHPRVFNPIDIKTNRLTFILPEKVRGSVAGPFSGGIDSFYTLWSHLPKNHPNPTAQITHGLFVHGFDIPLQNLESYQLALQKFSNMFRRLGLELLTSQTNVREFTRLRVDWNLAFGGALIGTALVLGQLLSRFYTCAEITHTITPPVGTSVFTDHLLSTETMDIVHHGASVTKIAKLSAIKGWEETHNRFRVCIDSKRLRGVQNCSRCYKCLRTMAMLEALDAFENFTTFRQPYRNRNIIRWMGLARFSRSYKKEISRTALSNRKLKLFIGVLIIAPISYIRRFFLRRILANIPSRIKYPVKRKIYGT